MSDALKSLLDRIGKQRMTQDERDEQIVSFVFGNIALKNPAVTHESVREVMARSRKEHDCRR